MDGLVRLAKAIKDAKRVFIAGNGGSAANALHFANDLVSCGIKAHALTADISTLTCIANDHDYVEVFSRQVRTFAEPGDLVLVLSGSGRSPNILAALAAAKEVGAKSWAIVGDYRDTEASKIADNYTKWGKDMQDAEEKQLYLVHKVMRWLKSS
jgi:phosphoheptose isomerase